MKTTRKREFPNTYVIVFFVLLVSALATWFVQGGEYVTEGGSVVYENVESIPQSWQVFTALYDGFSSQAGIILFILVIGGAFWVVNSVKAVDAGIYSFLSFAGRLEKYPLVRKAGVGNIVIVLVMMLFSLFGAVFGMSEETIAFAVIVIPLAISMGYDSIVGVLMVYVAAHVGFAGAMLNPFTIGIAQGMVGLPLFSGLGYRAVCWVVLTLAAICFTLWYASRIKRNPSLSPVYESDNMWRSRCNAEAVNDIHFRNRSSVVAFVLSLFVLVPFTVRYWRNCEISFGSSSVSAEWLLPVALVSYMVFSMLSLRKSVQFYVLNLLCFTIVYLVIGVLAFSWYIPEISALFLALGILSGISAGYDPNRIVKEFLDGAKDIFSAALIVGLAAGIVIILENGRIIDALLHSMAAHLGESGKAGSVGLMYAIQTIINLVIPSASAKAAITMPIMAPFADLIGVSRQATVLAFQFGDGFTNMITPTSGVLIAVLGIAGIPYSKWFRFIWPFILALVILGLLLLLAAIYMQPAGF